MRPGVCVVLLVLAWCAVAVSLASAARAPRRTASRGYAFDTTRQQYTQLANYRGSVGASVVDPRLDSLPVHSFDEVVLAALARHHNGTLQLGSNAPRPGHTEDSPLTTNQHTRWTQLVMHDGLNAAEFAAVPDSWDPRDDAQWQTACQHEHTLERQPAQGAQEIKVACTSPILKVIRDQGDCDADWAAGVASAFSDRLCLQTNGSIAYNISTEDFLSCCGWQCGIGCSGGYSTDAWAYLADQGAVTGGAYGSIGATGGCLPYGLAPCHHVDGNGTVRPCESVPGVTETPVCTRQCQNGAEWEMEKHYAWSAYRLANNSGAIAAEIFYHGSVTTTIQLYQDFLLQTPRNIYQHRPGTTLIGSLTVKLIGYGTAADTPYWIAATTWGSSWGPDGGFFRIMRGTNECNVENGVVAAMVRTSTPTDARSAVRSKSRLETE